MGQLFQRTCTVQVDTVAVTGLRVQFKVVKSLQPEPNTLDLSISNLAAETRQKLRSTGAYVVVEAGYLSSATGRDTSEVLFAGDSRLLTHTRHETDWVTRIQGGDGEKAHRGAKISESFGKGTTKADVLKKIMKSMAVDVKDAIHTISSEGFAAGVEQFTKGISLSGNSSQELTKQLDALGYSWSVQDGKMQLLKAGATTGEQAIVLSPDTGLVGSPELAEKYLKVKSLLQPGLKPGRRMVLDSESYKGGFRIVKVTHTGDTHGQAWYSECEAVPV